MFCNLAAKYYDKLPSALEELSSSGHYGYDKITSTASKHQICPFELSLDLSLKCDVIICDYNYAFDPSAHLKRFFDEGGDFILLIDEAHNLVDRARDMFSAKISKKEILALKRMLPKSPDKVEKEIKSTLSEINKVLLDYKKEMIIDAVTAQTYSEPPEKFNSAISSFIDAANPLIDIRIRKNYSAALIDIFFEMKRYQAATANYDDFMKCFAEKQYKDIYFKILCADPSSRLQNTYDKIRCVILFSASLTPFSYFTRLLGSQNAESHLLESPFPSDNLKILINSRISTKYVDRMNTALQICENIYSFVNTLGGCHMIFFPSYKYMEMIHALFIQMYPDIECPIQIRDMNEEERIIFLDNFNHIRKSPLACFVVMGGIFSEGIDLVGEKLIGAVIVSVGLPQMCFERDLIKAYHTDCEEPGFAYAYTYPGFNKIIQAVGRIIRTKKDKGAALLIDQRFSHKSYKNLMPHWWKPLYYISSNDDIEMALR